MLVICQTVIVGCSLDLKTDTESHLTIEVGRLLQVDSSQNQDQDLTWTTEQATIRLSQNGHNSIHTTQRTHIAVYEIKTVGLIRFLIE